MKIPRNPILKFWGICLVSVVLLPFHLPELFAAKSKTGKHGIEQEYIFSKARFSFTGIMIFN
jgi:hypothetical protein